MPHCTAGARGHPEHATSADSFGRSVSLVDYPADNNQSLVDDDSKDSTVRGEMHAFSNMAMLHKGVGLS